MNLESGKLRKWKIEEEKTSSIKYTNPHTSIALSFVAINFNVIFSLSPLADEVGVPQAPILASQVGEIIPFHKQQLAHV